MSDSNKEDLLLRSSDELKPLLYKVPNLSNEEHAIIAGSNISYLHLYFGEVPDNMPIPLFVKLLENSGVFTFDKTRLFPLYPIPQGSWSGAECALWLKYTIQDVHFDSVEANLTGNHIIHGFVLGVLNKRQVTNVSSRLDSKLSIISSECLKLMKLSSPLKEAVCRFFDMEWNHLPSMDELFESLRAQLMLPEKDLQPFESLGAHEWFAVAKLSKRERMRLDSGAFKSALAVHPDLSDEERVEVMQSDSIFLHFYFGVVPDRISVRLFTKLLNIKEFELYPAHTFPLFPIVQGTWTGDSLADWLIHSRLVEESRRNVIKKVSGQFFLEGYVYPALNESDMKKACMKLTAKSSNLSDDVAKLANEWNELKPALCAFFGMKIEDFDSIDQIQTFFTNNFTFVVPSVKAKAEFNTGDPNKFVIDAFTHEYLGKGEVANSFVEHIRNIVAQKKSQRYFASYTFLGQSSCMGKSRLLEESWQDDHAALFILRINCRKRGDTAGYPFTGNETSKFVNHVLSMKTQDNMAKLLWSLLLVVFQNAFDENNVLRECYTSLSYSLEDLGITFDEIKKKSFHASREYLKRLGLMITNMKLPGGGKKVIPIVAFDEAAVLIDTKFKQKYTIDLQGQASGGSASLIVGGKGEISTFRLIRRVLHTNGPELWGCPFVFAGTNTRIANFVPPYCNDPSVRGGYGVDDGVRSNARRLFDPYILTAPFNIFALKEVGPFNEIREWGLERLKSNEYIESLCKFGRPLWGAMLEAGKAELDDGVVDNIIRLSNLKLSYYPDTSGMGDIPATMAITGLLTSIDWSERQESANLVERQMAFLFRFIRKMDKLFICYPSEPVLAYVALSLLHTHTAEILKDIEKLKTGVFDRPVGEVGEFIAKIAFLLAIPSPISLNKPYCNVGDWFKNLLTIDDFAKLSKYPQAQRLMCGYFCFSHFAIFKDVCHRPLENLAFLVSLNAALATPKGFEKLDMVLPVVFSGGYVNSTFGSVNVQVKSWAKGIHNPGEIGKEMYSKPFCDPEILRMNLLMNISPFVEPFSHVYEDDDGIITLFIEGDPCLLKTLSRKDKKDMKGPIVTEGPLECIFHTLLSSGRQSHNLEDDTEDIPFDASMQSGCTQLNNIPTYLEMATPHPRSDAKPKKVKAAKAKRKHNSTSIESLRRSERLSSKKARNGSYRRSI